MMADETNANSPHRKPQVNLLPDDPTEDDRTGGGHRRVARAIADVVAGPNGGKAIALEGTWGSGKSSVVRMLPSECEHPTFVFEFDAWKHERDPLRVTFLNELTKALKRDGWIDKDTAKGLEQTFDEISGKVKSENKTESALFRARDLLLIAIVLVLVPMLLSGAMTSVRSLDDARDLLHTNHAYWLLAILVAAVLVSWVVRSASSLVARADTSSASLIGPRAGIFWAAIGVLYTSGVGFALSLPHWMWLAGLLASLALFALSVLSRTQRTAIVYLLLGREQPPTSLAALKDLRESLRRPSFIEHLLRRQPNEIETKIRGRRHLDIEEFEKYFVDIVRAASDGPKVTEATRNDFRLVIVLDNLDRLEPENALAVWATVQAFIELGKPASGLDEDDKALMRHAWLVVPYDRARLLPAVAQAGKDDQADSVQTETNSESQNDDSGLLKNYPSSFLDKSFVVRFEVPPLSSTGWKRHLWECLHDALPDLVGEATDHPLPAVVESIARLGTRASVIRQHPPSARSVIHFVNDIGALVRQHGERLEGYAKDDPEADVVFTLESLAAYALLRRWPRNAEAIRNELLRGPDAEVRPLPRGWQRDENGERLACLVFNTHQVSVAMELLLADSIGPALCQIHGEYLATLLEQKVFWQVFQQSNDRVQAAIQKRGLDGLINASLNLDHVFQDAGVSTQKNISQTIQDLLYTIELFEPRHKLPDACAAFIRFVPNETTFALVNGRLSRASANCRSPEQAQILAHCVRQLWAEALRLGVVRTSEPNGPDVPDSVTVPPERAEVAAFLSVLYDHRETSAWMWSQLSHTDPEKLLGAFVPTETTKQWHEHQYQALYVGRHSLMFDGMEQPLAGKLREWAIAAGLSHPDSLQFVLSTLRSDESAHTQASSYSVQNFNATGAAFHKALTHEHTVAKLYERFANLAANGHWDGISPILVWHGIREELGKYPWNHAHQQAAKNALAKWASGEAIPAVVLEGVRSAPYPALSRFLHERILRQDGCGLLRNILHGMGKEKLSQLFQAPYAVKQYESIYSCVGSGTGLIDTIVSAAIEFDDKHPEAVDELQRAFPWMDPHKKYWDEDGQ